MGDKSKRDGNKSLVQYFIGILIFSILISCNFTTSANEGILDSTKMLIPLIETDYDLYNSTSGGVEITFHIANPWNQSVGLILRIVDLTINDSANVVVWGWTCHLWSKIIALGPYTKTMIFYPVFWNKRDQNGQPAKNGTYNINAYIPPNLHASKKILIGAVPTEKPYFHVKETEIFTRQGQTINFSVYHVNPTLNSSTIYYTGYPRFTPQVYDEKGNLVWHGVIGGQPHSITYPAVSESSIIPWPMEWNLTGYKGLLSAGRYRVYLVITCAGDIKTVANLTIGWDYQNSSHLKVSTEKDNYIRGETINITANIFNLLNITQRYEFTFTPVCEIRIFSDSGGPIWNLLYKINPRYENTSIEVEKDSRRTIYSYIWNGTSNYGDQVGNGSYIINVTVLGYNFEASKRIWIYDNMTKLFPNLNIGINVPAKTLIGNVTKVTLYLSNSGDTEYVVGIEPDSQLKVKISVENVTIWDSQKHQGILGGKREMTLLAKSKKELLSFNWSQERDNGSAVGVGTYRIKAILFEQFQSEDTFEIIAKPQPPPETPPLGTSSQWVAAAPYIATAVPITILLLLAFFTELGNYTVALLLLSMLYPKAKKDSKIRWMILGYLMEHEGAHYRALLKELKIANGTLAYHLRRLEIEGMIVAKTIGLKKVFSLSGKARKETSK